MKELRGYAGFGLRSTRSGSLIVETEAVRRMLAGMERQESDQLPEEAPPEQVPEDEPGAGRDEAQENPGHPGAEDPQTGNPGAAGDED